MTVQLTSARAFGVEIECHSRLSFDTLARTLSAATGLQFEVQGWSQHTTAARGHNRGTWKIVPDGSLSHTTGKEVVSPVLSGDEGARQVTAVLTALRDAGATVDRACGMHVHHDANDITVDGMVRLVEGFAARQVSLMDRFVSPSRRNGRWASRLSGAEVRTATNALSNGYAAAQRGTCGVDRYRALNLLAYASYGTVEFRQHQGTLNASKVLAWVALGQAIVEAAIDGTLPGMQTSIEFLNEAVGSGLMHGSAARSLTRRAAAFGFDAPAITARSSMSRAAQGRRTRVANVSEETDAEAFHLRSAGRTWRQVAEALGLARESSARTAAGRHSARIGASVGYVPTGA